jgi:aryl-alcohol dehydrogenase-like predicted oxidoreductase
MQFRNLGNTGIRVSEIGFGAWAIGGGMWATQSDDDSVAALRKALDLGVNFIDTAAGYGNGRSEQVIARVLKERGAGERITVATKIPPTPGAWPPTPYDRAGERYPEPYLRERLEERLRFLQTDCIDILQLHVWTRAWNRDPSPLRTLETFKKEGKLRFVGLSTNDYDQDDCTTLFSTGVIDTIQLIYNLFEQNPAAEALPTALAHGVGVIVRVPFDEGSLTGKFTAQTTFPEWDFRNRYFGGDRLARTVSRVEKIKADVQGSGYSMPQAALKFILANPAVSVVIPGMRNAAQAEINVGVSDLPAMGEDLVTKLRKHAWSRGNWYAGK